MERGRERMPRVLPSTSRATRSCLRLRHATAFLGVRALPSCIFPRGGSVAPSGRKRGCRQERRRRGEQKEGRGEREEENERIKIKRSGGKRIRAKRTPSRARRHVVSVFPRSNATRRADWNRARACRYGTTNARVYVALQPNGLYPGCGITFAAVNQAPEAAAVAAWPAEQWFRSLLRRR